MIASDIDENQSHCKASAHMTHVTIKRGKSLSPPKLIRKQVIVSNALFNRCWAQRYPSRTQSFFRKQKIIAKAKQHARLSPLTVAKPIVNCQTSKPNSTTKSIETMEKGNFSDESEYSSLEDDDDFQGNFVITFVEIFY